MPKAAVDSLLGAIASKAEGNLDALAQAVASAGDGAEPWRLNEAVATLLAAPARPDIPAHLTGSMAILAGCLIESGADAGIAAGPMLALVERCIGQAHAFLEACHDTAIDLPENPDDQLALMEGAGREGERPGLRVGERWIPPDAASAIAERMPEAAEILGVVDPVARATIATLTRCPGALSKARAMKTMRRQLELLSESEIDTSGMLYWLADLLTTLDDFETVVLHPHAMLGYRVRISGVADNMQLQILLGAALIGDPAAGWLAGERPSEAVIANARGEGPQEIEGSVRGLWNMYWWAGLKRTCDLDVQDNKTWIWNEGVPADIPRFDDGTRVILLGPPTHERSMNTSRRFDGLRASVEVVEQLPPNEVNDWLTRIQRTPRVQMPKPRTWSGSPRPIE